LKHVESFDEFLRDTVNLNATRIEELEKSVEAVKSAIDDSAWGAEISDWMIQGSWAHKTIIKPVKNNEFDADLLVFVYPVEGWTAASYINELYNAFKAHGTYKDKVRRWSHCVTITYSNERRIDIAPCLINRGGFQRLEICNRDTDDYEPTEPRRYTAWLIERNSYSGGNSFRKVTRLVKYLRDIKGTFRCPSVLLTTLLGYRIAASDGSSDDFLDTPTSLRTIFARLDDWLQVRPEKPVVANPYLATEDFAESWSQEQYSNFRDVIQRYRAWVDDAFFESDRNESIAKWRRVFGDEFASGIVVLEAKSVDQSIKASLQDTVSTAALFAGDLVDAVQQFGARALPAGFDKQPHMKSPKWPLALTPSLRVQVQALLYKSKGYGRLRPTTSLEILDPGQWLEFTAVSAMGLPLASPEWEIKWRVTNTGEAASQAGQLRGSFEDSHPGHVRWEYLKYRGVHLVEAFVVRTRDDTVIAISPPFRVAIS
jgi:hypothetical protein